MGGVDDRILHTYMADPQKPLIQGLNLKGVSVHLYQSSSMPLRYRNECVYGIKVLDFADMEDFYDSIWRALISDNLVRFSRTVRNNATSFPYRGTPAYYPGDIYTLHLNNISSTPIELPIGWFNTTYALPESDLYYWNSEYYTPDQYRAEGENWLKLSSPSGDVALSLGASDPDLYSYDGFLEIPPGEWDLSICLGTKTHETDGVSETNIWIPFRSTSAVKSVTHVDFRLLEKTDLNILSGENSVSITEDGLHITAEASLNLPLNPIVGDHGARYSKLEVLVYSPSTAGYGWGDLSITDGFTGVDICREPAQIRTRPNDAVAGIGGNIGYVSIKGRWLNCVIVFDSLTRSYRGWIYDTDDNTLATSPVGLHYRSLTVPGIVSEVLNIRSGWTTYYGGVYQMTTSYTILGATLTKYGDNPLDWYPYPEDDPLDRSLSRRRRAAWMNLERPLF